MKSLKLLPILTLSFTLSLNALANSLEQLPENSNQVKAGDKFITLIGHQINEGDIAPNFKVADETFSPIMLSDFSDKNVLISVVPSLDTGVCSLQTKRFNDEFSQSNDDIVMLTISNDLPFAQKRFCKNENVDKIKVLSDSVWREFGNNYGLLIKDMGLLSRAIFVINKQGIVVYKELVSNISDHPDYEKALKALATLTSEEK